MAESDPKKKQMEYIAITGLVVAALFIGISRFKKNDAKDEVFSKERFKEQWKEVEILEKEVPKEEKPVSYDADAEKAPFKSPIEDEKKIDMAAEDVSLPSMQFQGMVWSSTRPQAIIDNKVYDVNDVIYIGSGEEEKFPIKIVEITKEGIYLRYKGKGFLVKPK
ncbi:MAG: general secretion pathway protein GspB [Candidatus Omnitrophica bacterium]|nr:general secretion pathway protein GspB [Candidatus Omnitrophota bacterium]